MKKVDIENIYKILKKEVPKYDVPVVELIEARTRDPFKILIITILSARTNDRTTAIVANKLFSKVRKLDDLEKLSTGEIEKLIYPVCFYRNKAIHLKKLVYVIKKDFHGKIPNDLDGLLKLPGVGRKTANIVLSVAFKKPGIGVDTHVHRIMNRLGYVKTKSPFETEMILRKKLNRKYWIPINPLLVAFGQNLCRPLSPHCSVCPIIKYCNQVNVSKKR